MTKTYAITEEQRAKVIEALSHPHGFRAEARGIMQSLPLITGEPVAWIWKYQDGSEEVVFVKPHRLDPEFHDISVSIIPLYTHPQPLQPEDFDTWQKNPYSVVLQKSIEEDYQPKLQPITADDVTNEMLNEFHEKSEVFPNPETLAIAYNAVAAHLVKNRSEAK